METTRRLGYVIDLKGEKINDLSIEQFYGTIAQKLWENGVICVKNQEHMNFNEYLESVNKLGPIIRLPPQLAFNNVETNYPDIVRVGNVSNTNEIMTNYTAAEYWHTDGQFWPKPSNFVVSWLLSSKPPETGGETAFQDMQTIYYSLPNSLQTLFSNSSFTINLDDVKDFKGLNAEEIGFQQTASHLTVIDHPLNLKKALYLGSENCIINYFGGRKERAEETIKNFAKKFPLYVHKWEKGDLLLWDNTQVLHRGLGGYANSPRLLYRCQSRITPFMINLIKRLKIVIY